MNKEDRLKSRRGKIPPYSPSNARKSERKADILLYHRRVLNALQKYDSALSELEGDISYWKQDVSNLVGTGDEDLIPEGEEFVRTLEEKYRRIERKRNRIERSLLGARRYLSGKGNENHGGLASKLSGIVGIIGLAGSVAFLSPNFTGNVIGFSQIATSNVFGAVLFLLGLAGAFTYFEMRK